MRELAIGAGGFVEQAISRDNYPSDACDTSNARTITLCEQPSSVSGNLLSDEYRLVWGLQLV
jgi:hypothetical protein